MLTSLYSLLSIVVSRRVLGAIAVCSLAACSLSVEISSKQCEENAECLAIAPDTECKDSICVAIESLIDSKFSCRDTPWKTLNNNSRVDTTFGVVFVGTGLPREGATIHQCNSLLDPQCLSPVDTQITDENGATNFDLPEGFNGHLAIEGTDSLAPMIVHIFPPPDPEASTTNPLSAQSANFSEIAATAAVLGVSIVPDTGIYLFTAIDCLGNPLSGVQVTISPRLPETETAYLAISGLPDSNLTHTGAPGTGAIVNLPTGFITVKAVHEDEGTIFEQTVLVAADTLTAALIVPSP